MSFLKNTTSFTRFKITSETEPTIMENLENKLRQFAFMNIDEKPLEKSSGWTSYDDMFDINFENSSPHKGDFITFSLRIDTRRIAPAVLKKYIFLAMKAEEEKLAEFGKKYISKDRKKEIVEQVKLQLRAKTLPVPAYFEVVWDYPNKILYLASTKRSVIDIFSEYFKRTFDVSIKQILPYTLAQNFLSAENKESLEQLVSTDFTV